MKLKFLFKVTPIAFLITIMSCNNAKNTDVVIKKSDDAVPTNIISVDEAVTMHDEYVKRIMPLIENDKLQKLNETYKATQYVYMNLDSLKQYIAFLDKVQEKNNKKISGLRVYFAAYPDAAEQSKFETDYPGRETFFMAPTMQVESTELSKKYNVLEQIPFYISPTGKDKYVGDYNVIEGLLCKADNVQIKTKSAAVQKSSSREALNETSLIANRLTPCPPPF
jgi:hypothetical protein